MKVKYNIEGLDCANCASELENRLAKVDGVKEVRVNFLTQKMDLTIDEARKKEIIKEVKKVIKHEEPDVLIEEV